jgi:hypothetical protein
MLALDRSGFEQLNELHDEHEKQDGAQAGTMRREKSSLGAPWYVFMLA